ncbi:MAG: hypothetical protein P9X27_02040 [Candidatus Kaelpia aquatica]|nr:hypothetical protein [Candidatus Kaelpia aquatica]
MAKENPIALIEGLGFTILSEEILVASCPISALAFKDDKFFFVEYLFKNNLEFIEKHFDWIKCNINLLKSKYRLKDLSEVNLLCLSFTDDELNLEVSGFKGELVTYRAPFKNGEDGLLSFDNWTFNKEYLKSRVFSLLSKIPREEADIVRLLLTLKSLFVREESEDYFLIQAQSEEYRLRFFKDFIWFHKGPAPFRPRKIAIKP